MARRIEQQAPEKALTDVDAVEPARTAEMPSFHARDKRLGLGFQASIWALGACLTLNTSKYISIQGTVFPFSFGHQSVVGYGGRILAFTSAGQDVDPYFLAQLGGISIAGFSAVTYSAGFGIMISLRTKSPITISAEMGYGGMGQGGFDVFSGVFAGSGIFFWF